MIYLELLIGFLTVGCFSFGGAYGAIPLIKEVVLSYGWVSEEMFTYFVAVSESTPGPIMVNLATYIGSSKGGFLGAMLATSAVVLPSFLIILLIVTILKKVLSNPYVQATLKGIEPCIIGIIFVTGFLMIVKNIMAEVAGQAVEIDGMALIIMLILLLISGMYKKKYRKAFSPIGLILTAAILGVILF